jgi:hypothetical protein
MTDFGHIGTADVVCSQAKPIFFRDFSRDGDRYKKSSLVAMFTIPIPSMLSIVSILPLFALSAVCANMRADTSSSPVAATWYGGWEATKFPPSSVNWEKYNTIYYSFA